MAASAQALDITSLSSRSNRLAALWRLARRKYLAAISVGVIAVFALTAVFAPLIAPYDPLETNTAIALQGPSLSHPLGTDELGRDVLSRLIYGARISLLVGFAAVTLQLIAGVTLGLMSAYFGGRIDLVLQRFIDALQAFPPLVLALVMVATLGASIINVILAIAVTGIAGKARVVRGTSLSLMQNPYVEAARTLGSGHLRVMMRHILPNAWAPVIVIATNSLGTAIVAEASLSFLGLGPPPPTPTWGGMLSGNARTYMQIAPWLALSPGIAITVVVIAFNLLGDGLRDILDPRLRGTR